MVSAHTTLAESVVLRSSHILSFDLDLLRMQTIQGHRRQGQYSRGAILFFHATAERWHVERCTWSVHYS
jgi:hypothetical protein